MLSSLSPIPGRSTQMIRNPYLVAMSCSSAPSTREPGWSRMRTIELECELKGGKNNKATTGMVVVCCCSDLVGCACTSRDIHLDLPIHPKTIDWTPTTHREHINQDGRSRKPGSIEEGQAWAGRKWVDRGGESAYMSTSRPLQSRFPPTAISRGSGLK